MRNFHQEGSVQCSGGGGEGEGGVGEGGYLNVIRREELSGSLS